MTLILFDLDDTLLGNEINNFIPAYLQSLAKRMSGVANPTQLINTLLLATRHMVGNLNPGKTLEQRFDESFFPTLGLQRQHVQGIIDTFYEQDFPDLKGLTQYLPNAVKIVEELLARGNQAAIATNPLFPRTAILQRLGWAGFPDEPAHFKLIPSYETFHFAKPNPAFFAELLAQLGWPNVPVVMVGNDVETDIGAAQQLGLPVFWITKDGATQWNGENEIPPHGEITDLISWMERTSPQPLGNYFSTPNALLAVLRSTPAALTTIYRQRSAGLNLPTGQQDWSITEVLCHLRDMDIKINIPQINKLLNEQNPSINDRHDELTEKLSKSTQQVGTQAMAEFVNARMEVLALLEKIPAVDWERQAQHSLLGSIQLRDMVNGIAGHDILHVQQVYSSLSVIT